MVTFGNHYPDRYRHLYEPPEVSLKQAAARERALADMAAYEPPPTNEERAAVDLELSANGLLSARNP